ncbi:HAMP domain-containing protein [Cohnella endophytica]|uniref:HAMP domain-containing protein n=1 Tax=Cohnella endophytica TaxID=2419778 RepID=A0A494XMZ0_9BACL|nr:histidine kinase [Cohnella endophytica]RKP48913.1 HAMP domain-containing protein [Cohnella endophytica]
MNKLRNSFFSKLIVILLLVNIPVVIGMLIFFFQSMTSLKVNAMESIRQNQSELMKTVESDIDYVKQQLFKISNMSDWNELNAGGPDGIDYSGISAINRFRERFQNTLDTSRLFSDVWANIPSADRRFSAKNGLEDFNAEENNKIRSFYRDYKRVAAWDGRMFITSKSGYSEDGAVNIAAEIDMQKLWKLVNSRKSFAREDMIFAFHGNEETYLYDTASEVARELIQADFAIKNTDIPHHLLIQTNSSLGDFTLYSLVPTSSVYSFLQRFYTSMFFVLFCTVAAIVSYFIVVGKLIKKPIRMLIDGFKQVEKGDFSTRLKRKSNDEISYLYGNFNTMSAKLSDLITENYIKEIYAQRAIYQQLQSQINPHFLYNSFYVLHHMIKEGDNENAEEFSIGLSQYYKFLTKNSSSDVLLREEMLHTEVYMNIMKKRYGSRVSIDVHCEDPSLLQVEVPRLILQPFVENIFKYGMGYKRESLQVALTIRQEGQELIIRISDNGKGIEDELLEKFKKELLLPDAPSDSAIYNINKRLKIKFGTDYGVSVTNAVSGGCQVEIHIPYRSQDAETGGSDPCIE